MPLTADEVWFLLDQIPKWKHQWDEAAKKAERQGHNGIFWREQAIEKMGLFDDMAARLRAARTASTERAES